MLSAVELVLILTSLTVGLYYYMTKSFEHWKSRGVKGPQPIVFFGTIKDVMKNKYSMGEYLNKIYQDFKNEPFCGIFLRQTPILVLNDLELIRDVLIKDFSKFADRGTPIHEKIEPLSPHLFNLEPARWRPLRLKLSPVFTSGKLREMFYLLNECAHHFHGYVDDIIKKSNSNEIVTEVRELTAKFTTDVIGVCAFGLQMNALASDDSPFRIMGRRIFATNWKRMLQFRCRTIAPKLFKIIGHLLVDTEMNEFFINTMKQTMDYRKKNNVVKHDFIDLLMEIKEHPDKLAEIELTDNLLAAQLFVFFIAGFETSSSTMSNAFYELAQNLEVQETLRREIKEEMKRTGGVIEYEGIKNMKYLDMVFQETLRKYPPVSFLMRSATEDYTFRNASKDNLLTIEKGQKIWISNYAIQRDPQYFPKPDVFDPERFTEEAIKSRHPMTNLSFGDGPRNCIGKRFGVMQTKVGIVKILNNFRVEVCDKTQIPYVINPKSFLLAPANGIHLKIIKINDDNTEL